MLANTPVMDAMVSIHASAREATPALAAGSPAQARFDPRLRAGGDEEHLVYDRSYAVSIHASAREATGAVDIVARPVAVSIHASAREATVRIADLDPELPFRSTPPRGRRRRWVSASP